MQRQDRYQSDGKYDSFWMPFTSNRFFKDSPQIIASAKGLYYQTHDGKSVIDGISGLWCSSLGHGRKEITEAVTHQLEHLDYAPSYQIGHQLPFALADRLLGYLPDSFGQVFFVNSGSEACETALKIALAYQQSRGKKNKTLLIGRELGFHGAGMGAISVGGITNNKKLFPNLLPDVAHLPSIANQQCFIKGEPEGDLLQANALIDLIHMHSAEKIAAVIVEPVCGSGGVLIPPKGYLKRLREICDEHDILLIVDEVICALGRLGHPFSSTDYFDVVPDMITTAKSMTNGVIPMGAVFVRNAIYNQLISASDTLVELFHGYTFSANPVACAAAMACMDICEQEGLYYRAQELQEYWQDAVHSLKGLPHVVDIRNLGLMAAIELSPAKDQLPGYRAWSLFRACFEQGLMARANGECLALCPPLTVEKQHIDQMIGILSAQLKKLS